MGKVTMSQPLLTDTSTTMIAPPAYQSNTSQPSNQDLKLSPPPYLLVTTNAKAPTQSLTIHATRVLPPVSFSPPPALETDFNISESDWIQFTQELQRAATPTACQKTLAVLGGVGTAGVIWEPWTASLVARWVWHAYTVRNIRKGLDGEDDMGVGEVLKTWNENWREIGVKVRVEVPELGKKAANGCGAEGSCGGKPHSDCMERAECHGKSCCRRKRTACDRPPQSGACAKQSGRCGRKQRRCAGRDEDRGECENSCGRKKGCCAGNEAKRVRIVVEKVEADRSVVNVEEKQSKDSKW